MGESARRKKLTKSYGEYYNASSFSQLKQKIEVVISRIQDISDNFRHLDNLSFRKDMVQVYYETDLLKIQEILSKWQEEREILEQEVKKEINNYFQHYNPSVKTSIAELMMFYLLKIYIHESMSERGVGEKTFFLYFSGDAIIKALEPHSDRKMHQEFKTLFNESMSRGIQTEKLPKLINFNEKIQNRYPQLKVEKIQYCYRSSVPITRVMDS
jgi:DNA replicative helicase MCM subunit Mcm2 (Cdc46/Mcm family)